MTRAASISFKVEVFFMMPRQSGKFTFASIVVQIGIDRGVKTVGELIDRLTHDDAMRQVVAAFDTEEDPESGENESSERYAIDALSQIGDPTMSLPDALTWFKTAIQREQSANLS